MGQCRWEGHWRKVGAKLVEKVASRLHEGVCTTIDNNPIEIYVDTTFNIPQCKGDYFLINIVFMYSLIDYTLVNVLFQKYIISFNIKSSTFA